MNEAAVAGLARRYAGVRTENTAFRRAALQAELIWGERAFDVLSADWRRLARASHGTVFFQSPDFLAAWARNFRAGGRLVTVVVHEDGRPALIWPLVIERRFFLRIARGAGAPISQYDDILVEPGADARSLFKAAIDALSRAAHPDLLLLERVRADSMLRAALSDTQPAGWGEAAPYTDLSQGAEAALAALKPGVMKKQRKRVRRFQKEGAVDFAVAECPATAEAWMREAVAMKRDWLKATGRLSRAFVGTAMDGCLRDLTRGFTGPGRDARMLVARLTLDGRPAAYEAGFCHGGTYYIYLRAFAPELAAFGPGNVLSEQTLTWCAAHGITRYDMMAPRSRNKREWQSDEVAVVDFAISLSTAGRLYAATVQRRAVPALRAFFYALPAPLRSAIAAVAIRI